MFISKLNLMSDIELIKNDLLGILQITQWHNNQIGLNHKYLASNIWEDATGSLYNKAQKKFIATESEFNIWNLESSNYIRQQIEMLVETQKFRLGRVRFMKLNPHCGLSVHYDKELRYHLAIETNKSAFICNNINDSNDNLSIIAQCYHIPNDSYWYKVDTTQVHWVYNGGETERIHLLVCES